MYDSPKYFLIRDRVRYGAAVKIDSEARERREEVTELCYVRLSVADVNQ